ncbi:MAG: hypothetical protein ACI9VX_002075 [Dinoroseobacter sp.]|jgi:uncharacterized protein (DUF1800 family)
MGAVFDERRRMLLRATHTQVSLHDRLTEFWQDHFTVRIAPVRLRAFVPLFTENAIRPHVAGRFADMLKAVVTHPAMLLYLDQATAVGPSSDAGKRTGRGLNENLAREVLELHTLGVGGPYSQDDVRQLAELFTGLRADFGGFSFRPHLAEPGAEIVLGRSYGSGGRAQLDDVLAALEDLAAHPATAAHIARKLAVHFTSDTPDAGLIADLSDTFTRTGGDLAAMIGVLIDHPATHASFGEKARRPLEFVLGGMRALAPDQARLEGLSNTNLRDLFDLPLEAMGQPHRKAPGPDGWAETAEAWITPQGLAARISWAMVAPSEIRRDLPDPRVFVDTSLGPLASAETRFAARAAETRWEGVGVILSAPEFHRR